MKYILYVEDKEGYVTAMGEFESIEDIQIRISVFSPGTILRIGVVEESK